MESSGRVGQLVHDGDTAWHCGNFDANCRSIGIEHANRGDSVTDECLESGAHLVAAIHRFYGLGRPRWGVNVFPHSRFSSTDCPGPLREGTGYHDRYMARAAEWYDAMASGSTPPAPRPAPAPSGALEVDGWWGEATTRALQRAVGTPVDGVVSSQDAGWRDRFRACTSGWEWLGDPGHGSQLVVALQRRWGLEADGIAGPQFINRLIELAGYDREARPVLDGPSNSVKWLQRQLNAGTL